MIMMMKTQILLLCIMMSVTMFSCSKEEAGSNDSNTEKPSKPDPDPEPDPVPDPDLRPKLEQVVFMTYNIHSGVPDGSTDSKANIKGIAEVINLIDPDIVFLQEVDKNANRYGANDDQAAVLAKLTDRSFHYFPARNQGLFGYFGVAILSKYPLSSAKIHYLTRKDGLEQRVLGTAKVSLPGNETIMAAVTHLQHNDAENRLDQVRDIIEILDNPEFPVVLGGDFNEKTTAVEFFSAFDAAFKRTCTSYGCPNTFPTRNPSSEIDFLACRPKDAYTILEHTVETGWNASDHLPVVATLKLNREKE